MLTSVGDASKNISDRDFFVYHRAHNDGKLYVGKPVRSRTAGDWLIPVTRRFNLADGTFGGVAVAALDPKKILGVLRPA